MEAEWESLAYGLQTQKHTACSITTAQPSFIGEQPWTHTDWSPAHTNIAVQLPLSTQGLFLNLPWASSFHWTQPEKINRGPVSTLSIINVPKHSTNEMSNMVREFSLSILLIPFSRGWKGYHHPCPSGSLSRTETRAWLTATDRTVTYDRMPFFPSKKVSIQSNS